MLVMCSVIHSEVREGFMGDWTGNHVQPGEAVKSRRFQVKQVNYCSTK